MMSVFVTQVVNERYEIFLCLSKFRRCFTSEILYRRDERNVPRDFIFQIIPHLLRKFTDILIMTIDSVLEKFTGKWSHFLEYDICTIQKCLHYVLLQMDDEVKVAKLKLRW